MYLQVLRLSENHTTNPVSLTEWQQLVESDPTFYWAENVQPEEENNTAVYFIDMQDEKGMDWFLCEDGSFKFQNTRLSMGHPYIQKIFEVADKLNAQVVQDEQIVLTNLGIREEELPLSEVKPVSPITQNTETYPVNAQPSVPKEPTPQDPPKAPVLETDNCVYDFPVLEVKPQRPKNLGRLKNKLKPPTPVTHVRLYTNEQEFYLGNAFQGELAALISQNDNRHYLVKNVWLELIARSDASYTFRLQTAFVAELSKAAYLYNEGSKIVVGNQAVSLVNKRH